MEQRFETGCEADCGCGVSRRHFLSGAAALGTVALLPGVDALAQQKGASVKGKPFHRVDVHHHFGPPFWAAAAKAAGQGGGAPWTVEGTLADMEKGGVAKAVLSLVQPGTWFKDDQQARSLSREVNDYAARLRSDHPGHFGIFTTLPMPDVEGSLKEIEYGMDVLKADGVGCSRAMGPNTWAILRSRRCWKS